MGHTSAFRNACTLPTAASVLTLIHWPLSEELSASRLGNGPIDSFGESRQWKGKYIGSI